MTGQHHRRLAVDAVLCISLKDRVDRRAVLLEQFALLGHPVEFVLVDRDAEDPERGCYRSHQRCAAIAVERGCGRVLILEDDATLEPFDGMRISRINRFLAWRRPDLFYLGGILGRMWHIPFSGIVRCRLSGCHAYVLSARACQHLLDLPYKGWPVDSVIPKVFRGYGAYPMLCQQQPENRLHSDIAEHRFRRLAGDARVKNEEFWRRNRDRQYESVRQNWIRTLLMRW